MDIKKPSKSVLKASAIAAVGVLASALLARLFTDTDSAWFQSLSKPTFMPPDLAFGIAWAILYGLMIVAFARLLLRKDKRSIAAFCALLTLLPLWNYAFFGLHNTMAGVVLLVLCVALCGYLIQRTLHKDMLACALLMVLIAWLLFALTLNFFLFLAN